jgi:hypothetical protein
MKRLKMLQGLPLDVQLRLSSFVSFGHLAALAFKL